MRTWIWMAGLGLVFGLTADAQAADVEAGKARYGALCASCHGPTGKGDGPAGGALNPKPRDLSDPAWQAKVSDEHIRKVTKQGGPAVGLSPLMPPLGAGMSDADLDNVVAFIRSLSGK